MSRQTVDEHFKNKFAIVKQHPKPASGPWTDDAPLKSRPKQVDANDPDRIGG